MNKAVLEGKNLMILLKRHYSFFGIWLYVVRMLLCMCVRVCGWAQPVHVSVFECGGLG